jgi:hypothetical protein
MEPADLVKGAAGPIIETVDETVVFGVINSGPLAELAVGLIVLVAVIAVHGWSMGRVSRRFARRAAEIPVDSPAWRIKLLMGTTIGLLAVAHLAATLLWAWPLSASGLIPNFRDSYYFVLETYTTLGDSDIALPTAWRLIGPLIAISGLFSFSWTASVLVFVVSEAGRWHAAAGTGITRPPVDPRPGS